MAGESVRLVEMDAAAYLEYRKNLIRDYAREKVESGAWSRVEAQDRATGEIEELLPDGPETRGHAVLSVRDESVPDDVGIVWFAIEESSTGRKLWIYDIIVHEQFRRRGYGTRALELIEDRARDLGAGRIELHVFGHNHGARKLYEAVGYRVTDINMAKALPAEGR